jgi:hypothetical protein
MHDTVGGIFPNILTWESVFERFRSLESLRMAQGFLLAVFVWEERLVFCHIFQRRMHSLALVVM